MKRVNRPPAHESIDCGVAAYLAEVVEQFTRLESGLETMRWYMHRGEPDWMVAGFWKTKKALRELQKAMQMLEHCMENPSEPLETKPKLVERQS